jgi:hypothetical protein
MHTSGVTYRFLAFFILCSSSVFAMQFDMTYGDRVSHPSRINDGRNDGISHAANRAKLAYYLQDTYNGKKLEGFSLPGTQYLKLEYWDDPESRMSDSFLQILETWEISPQSNWIVNLFGVGIWRGNRTLLSNVLHKLPSISVLYWRLGEPIPPDTIEFLESKHPLCQLHYEMDLDYEGPEEGGPVRHGGRHQEDDEQTLARREKASTVAHNSILNSSILHSLKVEVQERGRKREPRKMDLVLRILTTCPNVKELDISVNSMRAHGRRLRYPTDDLCAFDFTSSNQTLAPLESLSIEGYGLHEKPNGLRWMEWEADEPQRDILYAPWKYLPIAAIKYFGYSKINEWGGLDRSYLKQDTSQLKSGAETNIDIWLDRMDWSQLYNLSIKNPSTKDLAKLGSDRLPNLRAVQFSGYYADHHAILDFISNSSSHLESIQFDGIHFCSLTQVANILAEFHGSTLQTLIIKHSQPSTTRYRSTQNLYRFPRTSFLNATHLVHLRDSMPKLATLDLDIFVDEEWDYEVLDTLTSFTELENLTLRFEAHVSSWDGMGEEEEEEEEDLDGSFGYYGYKNSETTRSQNKLYLMTGVKEYLTKRKAGKRFKKLETWVGKDVWASNFELS